MFKHPGRVANPVNAEVSMPSFTDPPRGGKGPIRLPLRLVHPAPPSPPRRGRKRIHANDLFTPEELRRLRAAFRNAREKFGSWPRLCKAMGVGYQPVKDAVAGRHRVSGALAIRLARALGVPLESLLGALTVAPSLPTPPAAGGAA